jgi:hypothetical protein
MSRYSRVKQEEQNPWKFNEINVLLRKVKEDATLADLVRIHRRHPDTIKAKLNTLAADYYFTNADLFKQIQNITGVTEKNFLVRRDSVQSTLSMESHMSAISSVSTISGSSKTMSNTTTSSVAVNTDIDGLVVLDEAINLGICQGLAVSILDKIIGGTTVLRSTIQVLSTPTIKA